MHGNRSGYTLIELSVVVIIIGLVLGGILQGQSMIQLQRVRTVLVDAKTYAISIQQFKEKYGYLPGDFSAATSVWGGDTNDGNGNGVINVGTAASTTAEMFQAWKQMALAGIIAGNFTGVSGAGGALASLPGVNIPSGSIQQSGFTISSYGAQSGSANLYDGDYDNIINFGLVQSNLESYGPALKPKEAAEIDKKGDDGLPGLGSIVTHRSAVNANCVANDTSAAAATYNQVYNAAAACDVIFLSSFLQQAP